MTVFTPQRPEFKAMVWFEMEEIYFHPDMIRSEIWKKRRAYLIRTHSPWTIVNFTYALTRYDFDGFECDRVEF